LIDAPRYGGTGSFLRTAKIRFGRLIIPNTHQYATMRPRRRWLRSGRRGVSEVVGAVLLISLTLVAGIILWTFHINTPPSPPQVTFAFRSGTSNPVWGDPTDLSPNGTYSVMPTSQIIVAGVSSTSIPLTRVNLAFICNGLDGQATPAQGGRGPGNNTTVLISGSLASMTWYPGFGSYPSSGPKLGWCANFNAGGYGGGAFGVFFNRLGLFDPLTKGAIVLESGDTFLLYIHNSGLPLDWSRADCSPNPVPCSDQDDYHGAPPWCFTDPGACTIVLTYTGNPSTTLAAVSLVDLAPPH
jgi:flagellin-like protein